MNFNQIWLFVADWLSVHSLPTIAGFIGGLVGAEVRARLGRRKEKKQCRSEP